MVDRGPLLTSVIIFYLSIGAAIFQVLEEPNWTAAVDQYKMKKSQILEEHPCLTQAALEKILARTELHLCTQTNQAEETKEYKTDSRSKAREETPLAVLGSSETCCGRRHNCTVTELSNVAPCV